MEECEQLLVRLLAAIFRLLAAIFRILAAVFRSLAARLALILLRDQQMHAGRP